MPLKQPQPSPKDMARAGDRIVFRAYPHEEHMLEDGRVYVVRQPFRLYRQIGQDVLELEEHPGFVFSASRFERAP